MTSLIEKSAPTFEIDLPPTADVTLRQDTTIRGAGDIVRAGPDVIEFASGAKVLPNGFCLTLLEK